MNNYQNLGWRQFTNVSIDTLYFSVFYGGSSEMFMAHKDEVISCFLLYADLVTLVLCLVQHLSRTQSGQRCQGMTYIVRRDCCTRAPVATAADALACAFRMFRMLCPTEAACACSTSASMTSMYGRAAARQSKSLCQRQPHSCSQNGLDR